VVRGKKVVYRTAVHQFVVFAVNHPVYYVATSVVGGMLDALDKAKPCEDLENLARKEIGGDIVVNI
jgi:hypothetical protein